ncbi:MAG: hypothetical protein U0W24_23605 [Bacteroidales bacterium]
MIENSKYFVSRLFKECLFVFFVLGSAFPVKSQLDAYQIKQQFALSEPPLLAERIFIHTDRNDYITGETIWFKAYYFLNGAPDNNILSKVLYLELVDANGISVVKNVFPVTNEGSSGGFEIPESLISGYYSIVLYTKWMRNIGINSFSNKKIFILNPKRTVFTYKTDSLSDKQYSLNFYPCGGKLLAGFENKVYYSIKNQLNKKADVNVRILDDDNMPVLEFKSQTDSFNYFSFVPHAGKKYKAVVKSTDNTINVFNLPAIYDYQVGVRISTISDDLIKIEFITANNASGFSQNLTLEYQSNGYIYKKIRIPSGNNSLIINKKDLFPGENLISVLNESGEQIYAMPVNLDKIVNLEVTTDKPVYSKREKVNLYIKNINTSRNEKLNYFSVSVAKAKKATDNHDDDNSLPLDLYHSGQENRSDSAGKIFPVSLLPEINGQVLSGTIAEKNSGKPVSGAELFLSGISDYIIVQNTISGPDGKFWFNLSGLNGTQDLAVQVSGQGNFEIIFDKEYNSNFKPLFEKAISECDFNVSFYKDLSTSRQVQQQYAQNQSVQVPVKESFIFYGKADTSYFPDKYIDMPDIEDFFNEIVEGVRIKSRKEEKELFVNYFNTTSQLSLKPLLLVDGIPVFSVPKFLGLSPQNIQRIDIINRNYILGNLKFGGLINLISKKKNFSDIPNFLSFIRFDGFAHDFLFNPTIYGSELSQKERIPDFRNTIYWNPLVTMDKNDEAQVSFYTSDQPGTYLVSIVGTNSNGNLVNKNLTIEVH